MYAPELHSMPAILVTESDETGSFGLVLSGSGLQDGAPVGEGASVGCCVGDDEVADEVGDGATDAEVVFG